MEKVRRIDEDTATELYKELDARAIALADEYERLGFEGATPGLFFSEAEVPCFYEVVYRDMHNKRQAGEEPPDWFRCQEKESRHTYREVVHFSPAGCPSLRAGYSVVECLCRVRRRDKWGGTIGMTYYHGFHRAGRCPHKERC